MSLRNTLAFAVVIAVTALPAWGQVIGGVRTQASARENAGPTIDVTPYAETDGVYPGSTMRVALEVQLAEGWHVNAHEPLEDYLIPTALTFEERAGFEVESVVYPEGHTFTFDFSEEPLLVYEENFLLGAVVAIDRDISPGEYELKATLQWQACNDKQCWRPLETKTAFSVIVVPEKNAISPIHSDVFGRIDFSKAVAIGDAPAEKTTVAVTPEEGDWESLVNEFEITGREYGYIRPPAFIDFIDRSEQGRGIDSLFAGQGLFMVLVLTLVGGLALNLTPCVLPMIPINLAIIGAGAQAGSRKRGFALGGTYGLAIAFVYGLLGVIVVVTAGTFGAINQAWWFNMSIAAVFVVLALAMFDVISIDFSKLQGKLGGFQQGRGTFYLAFFMGCVAALLAGACVAPVVIAVILFSQDLYADGYVIAGVSLPFILGLGMALPWPFAGGGLSFLPKPGKWMTYVKYAFGVFILGFAAYYAHLGWTLLPADSAKVEQSVAALDDGDWYHSLTDGLAVAAAEDKPVLIDFWATWCKNCLTMNKTTFKDESVTDRLEGYVKIKYQAEDYSEPTTKAVMDHFEVQGLPTYIVMEPKRGETAAQTKNGRVEGEQE